MIVVIAEFDVKKDCVDEFVRHAAECTRNTKKEAGNLSYKVFSDRTDNSKFTFIEEWANDTAIERHNNMPHFDEFLSAVKPLLNKQPEIKQVMRVAAVR